MSMLDELQNDTKPKPRSGVKRYRERDLTEARLLGLKRFLEDNYGQPVCNLPNFRRVMTPVLAMFSASEEPLLAEIVNAFADHIDPQIDLSRSPIGYWFVVFPDWAKWELGVRRSA